MKKQVKNKEIESIQSLSSLLVDGNSKSKFEKASLKIRDLWEMEGDDIINLEPFYQRNVVWKPEYQVNLIHSILNGVPINVIHLVIEKTKIDEDEKTSYVVLDGKQRITTIFDFMQSKFDIKIKLGNEFQDVSYRQLNEMRNNPNHKFHERAKSLIRKLEQYEIIVMYWSDLDLIQQSVVFNAINFGVELSTEERVLARSYNSKIFALHILKTYLSSLFSYSRTKDDKRGKDIIWTLRFLYIIFGGSPEALDIKPELICKMRYDEGFQKFIEDLHNKIENYKNDKVNAGGFDDKFDSKLEMNKMLLAFGLLNEFKDVQKFVDDIALKIVGQQPSVRVISSDWVMIYYTTFILNKFYQKRLRYGVFSDNIPAFKSIFTDYKAWTLTKDSGEKYEKTRRMTFYKTYNLHMNKIQELFEQHVVKPGITDDEPKSTYIPSYKRAAAWKKANGVCPLCKVKFTETDELQYDHGVAASISSDPVEVFVMHRKCNRQKSDHTPQTAQQLNDFMKKAV